MDKRIANKTALLFALTLLCVAYPQAQTDTTLRVENGRHSFAFTVMENSLVTYEQAGDGFSAIYNSQGGGKGTRPDYGLLVYGAAGHLFSTKEAIAAGFDPPVATVLTAVGQDSQEAWQAIYSAQMKLHGREQSGLATVTGVEGKTFKIPCYSWSQTIGLKTAHALTYVVLHGSSFIHVQVESSRPLAQADLIWVTSKLELLDLKAPTKQ